MKITETCILEDRGIVYIQGSDAKEFLQNIVTNNLEMISDNHSIYSSLLTPQGKYLYDFILVKFKKGYLIDCEKKELENLIDTLNIYKLRSKVEILNLSEEFVVASLSYDKYLSLEKNQTPGFTTKYREDIILLDPRNIKLGARLIASLEKLHLSLKKLNLKIINKSEYYKESFNLGIAQINSSKLKEKLFGIECNYEELNGIDFKKGCYVGQENTARIKLKNKLSKRLLPIEIIKGKLSENEKILNNDIEIGRVLIDGDYPFALIKYLDKNFDKDLVYKGKNGSFKILIPQWLQSKFS